MVVQVEESVLIAIFGIIVVPLVLFLFRMIIKVNHLEGRLDALVASRARVDEHIIRLGEHESDIRLLKLRLDNLERNNYKKS